VALVLGVALSGSAFDFGLITRQGLEFADSGEGGAGEAGYTGSYSPWFSSELGQRATLFFSATISTAYGRGGWQPAARPILLELGRSALSWRPLSSIYIEAGRVPFEDPAGIIASGLFDGITGSAVLGQARFSAGVFYTGLLYKDAAAITMTAADGEAYADEGAYFASRRVLYSATTELPTITPHSGLVLNVLLQFDANGKASSLHTQYLSATYTEQATETLSVSVSAVASLAEDHAGAVSFHDAAVAAADWEVPGEARDLLRGEIRWTSGAGDDTARAFTPVTAIPRGRVFDPPLPGLLTLTGTYTRRIQTDWLASAEGACFITTSGAAESGRLLGGEVYGAVSWAPVSDFMASIGGGVFLPSPGNASAPSAPARWKLTAGLALSL
jgi:hypothetical protein